MRIAGRERLEQFCEKHADARAWIERWLAHVELAAWTRPAISVANTLPPASSRTGS